MKAIVPNVINIKIKQNFNDPILSPTALYPTPKYTYSYIAKIKNIGKIVKANIEITIVKIVKDFMSIKIIITTIRESVTAFIEYKVL